MSVFFDELQKQYANAEQKAQQAYNTGINMLQQKGNMLQQLFANQMQTLGTGADIMSRAGQIPANMASIFGNIMENEATRKQNQKQFDMSYNLDKQRLSSQNAYNNQMLKLSKERAELDKKLINKQISDLDYEKGIIANQTAYDRENLFSTFPQSKTRYMELKKQFPNANETQIVGFLKSEGIEGKFGKEEVSGLLPTSMQNALTMPSWYYDAKKIFNESEYLKEGNYGL